MVRDGRSRKQKRFKWLIWLKNQWRDNKVATSFLAIAIIFGFAFLVLVPPTQAADETTHFHRAYQLSQGDILSKSSENGFGDYLPRDVEATSHQLFADIPSHPERLFHYHQLPGLIKQRINFQDRVFVHLEGSTVYSPVPYIPQAVAIEATKIVWPSALLMYYAARFANLVVWIVLMYIAIRLWPFNKWPIFALALTPMSLSQAATVSPDALGNSLAFLMISAMLYYAHKRKKLTSRDMVLAVVGIVLLALTKPVFFVFGLLALLLSAKQLGSVRRYLLFVGSLLLAGLVATVLWNAQVKTYSAGIQHYYYPTFDISETRQLRHIISYPLGFVHTLGRTYLSNLGDIVTKSFIGRLGWFDTDMPLWLVVSSYTLIVLAILNRDPKEEAFTRRTRYVSGAIFALGFLVTSAILYLTITSVGDTLINNVQGRYFIAFTPLLVSAFGGLLKTENWDRIAARLFPISYSIILSASLLVVVNRFI